MPDLLDVARICAKAYDPVGSFSPKDVFPNAVDHWSFYSKSHWVCYHLVELNDRFIVVFRGSVWAERYGYTTKSWHLNVRAAKREIPFGVKSLVHEGYLEQAEAAWKRLKGRLSGKPVTICGHSQGGALALAFALTLFRLTKRRDLDVVTLGQPMLLGFGLARYLDRHGFWPTERFVNVGDGITLLPSYFLGYDHCERATYQFNDGSTALHHHFLFNPISLHRNHIMASYIARIALS